MGHLIISVILIIAGLIGYFCCNSMTESKKKQAEEYKQKLKESSYNKEHYEEVVRDKMDSAKQFQFVGKLSLLTGVVLPLIILTFSVVSVVPTGYTGIKTTFGKVEDDVLPSGVNFILPWQSVITMDNRTQKVQLDTQAFSSDIQQVDIRLSVNYNIDQTTAQVLYKTVGVNYYENVMFPRIQENTKAVFSQYSAENLVEKRNLLSDQVAEATSQDLKQYGINIVSVSIENIDFTDAFTDAVEAKQVAAQRKLTAETEQAQKTMEEEAAAKRAIIAENAKAEQAIIAANADLQVVQIQAEASLYAGQREAEMNQRIGEALTPDLIKYYMIKQWDGKLPTTSLGTGSNVLFNLTEGDLNE